MKIKNFFTNGVVASVLALCFLAFLILVLPAESKKMAEYIPAGASIDTGFGLSPGSALEKLGKYSSEQRLAYIHARWTFDVLWPLVYGIALYSIWSWSLASLQRRFQKLSISSWHLNLVPIFALSFDFAENISATVLMSVNTEQIYLPALALSISNTAKWIFVGLAMLGGIAMPSFRGLLALIDKIKGNT